MNRGGEAPRAVDKPEPGFFRLRLVKGGPYVGACIRLDVDGKWSAEIDGAPQGSPHADPVLSEGVFRVWLSGQRCDEVEHNYLVALSRWAKENDPRHPLAHPRDPIALQSAQPLY